MRPDVLSVYKALELGRAPPDAIEPIKVVLRHLLDDRADAADRLVDDAAAFLPYARDERARGVRVVGDARLRNPESDLPDDLRLVRFGLIRRHRSRTIEYAAGHQVGPRQQEFVQSARVEALRGTDRRIDDLRQQAVVHGPQVESGDIAEGQGLAVQFEASAERSSRRGIS